MDITSRQERFIEELLIDLNATQAAIRAGYSERTAESQGSRLLRNAKVQAELTRRRSVLMERTHIDQDRVVAELAALGLSNIADFLDPETGAPVPLHQLSRFTTAAVKKLKVHETLDATGTVTKRTTEIELLPKEAALEKLGRHLGVFDGRASEPTPPRDEKHHDPSVSPARRLATLVMTAMREAKERRIAEDGNGDLPSVE